MSAPTAMLAALQTSTLRLLRGVAAERWTDDEVLAPSLLPDFAELTADVRESARAPGPALRRGR